MNSRIRLYSSPTEYASSFRVVERDWIGPVRKFVIAKIFTHYTPTKILPAGNIKWFEVTILDLNEENVTAVKEMFKNPDEDITKVFTFVTFEVKCND